MKLLDTKINASKGKNLRKNADDKLLAFMIGLLISYERVKSFGLCNG